MRVSYVFKTKRLSLVYHSFGDTRYVILILYAGRTKVELVLMSQWSNIPSGPNCGDSVEHFWKNVQSEKLITLSYFSKKYFMRALGGHSNIPLHIPTFKSCFYILPIQNEVLKSSLIKTKEFFWIAHSAFFGNFKNIIPFKTIKIIWRVFQVIPWWWINCFDNPLAKQEVATESDPNGSQLRILTFRFAENSNNPFCFEVNAVPMIEGESKYHSPDAKKNIAPTPYGRACVVCGQRTKFSCYGCSLDSFGPVHICHPKYDRENRNCWSHCHQIRSIEYQYHTEYKS